MNTYEILEALASNRGRKFKEDLVESQRDNATFRRVAELALAPLTQFYIRQIPDYAPGAVTLTLDQGLDQLGALSRREVTGHAARDHLAGILSSVTPSDAEVLRRVIAKDLKCGVSGKTVNKTWPGLVFEYPVMLASKQDDRALAAMTWPACAQVKMDGMRANIVIEDGVINVYTRSGRLVELHGAFDGCLAGLDNIVIDGELLVRKTGGGVEERKVGNGILNRAVKGTITPQLAQRVVMHAWDLIDLAAWKRGRDTTPYRERFERLAGIVEALPCVELIHYSRSVANLEEAQAAYQDMYGQGEEGIILKSWAGEWSNTRSRESIKFKNVSEADLTVVGWELGTGKNQGRLGALICETRCGQLRVNVGTGFSDAQREAYGDSDNIVGRVVTVQYMEQILSKADNSLWSLYLPRFVELREDKDVANSREELD